MSLDSHSDAEPVTFRLTVGTKPVVVGTLSTEKRLVLKDFTSSAIIPNVASTPTILEIRADGEVVAEIPPDIASGTFNAHFTAGVVIRGGRELSIRLSTGSTTLSVSGVLE